MIVFVLSSVRAVRTWSNQMMPLHSMHDSNQTMLIHQSVSSPLLFLESNKLQLINRFNSVNPHTSSSAVPINHNHNQHWSFNQLRTSTNCPTSSCFLLNTTSTKLQRSTACGTISPALSSCLHYHYNTIRLFVRFHLLPWKMQFSQASWVFPLL
jgi:hypothetical protein